MKITKCKWKYRAQAPFMLMIDYYCNKYMTDKNNGNYLGADWGGRCKADYYPLLRIIIFSVSQ